jgi:hypothetical protein
VATNIAQERASRPSWGAGGTIPAKSMFEKRGLSLGRFGGKRGAAMDGTSTLGISPEKVCYIIVKARQFEAKDVVTDPDSGSNPVDDGMVSVLEDQPDDPVYEELMAFIGALDEDEQIDLIALTWLGRGRRFRRGVG